LLKKEKKMDDKKLFIYTTINTYRSKVAGRSHPTCPMADTYFKENEVSFCKNSTGIRVAYVFKLLQGPMINPVAQIGNVTGLAKCRKIYRSLRKTIPAWWNVKSLAPGTGRLFREEKKLFSVAEKMFLY
jgi:hypothetical protein